MESLVCIKNNFTRVNVSERHIRLVALYSTKKIEFGAKELKGPEAENSKRSCATISNINTIGTMLVNEVKKSCCFFDTDWRIRVGRVKTIDERRRRFQH